MRLGIDGEILFLDSTIFEILELSSSHKDPEDAFGKKIFEYISDPGKATESQILEKLQESGELSFDTISGKRKWVRHQTQRMVHPRLKEEFLQVIFKDITSEKNNVDEVRSWEKRFNIVSQQTGQLLYDWDVLTGKIAWSGAIEEVTGYGHSEFQQFDIDCWSGAIFPEDRDKTNELLEKARLEKKQFHSEYRFRRKDGSYIFVEDTGVFIEDFSGKVVQMLGSMKDISKRKHDEKQLRLKLFSIDHSSDSVFWISHASNFQFVNDAACRMLGYKHEDLVRLCIFKIFTVFDPEKWLKFWEELKEKICVTLESDLLARDSRRIPVEISFNYFSFEENEYCLAFVRDISERKLAEAAIRESGEQFKAIFSNAMDGILLADTETKKFFLGNAAISRFLGYTEEEIVSLSVSDIHPPGDLRDVENHFQKQAKGDYSLARDIPMRKKDGTIVYADINSIPIVISGRNYLLGMFRNVTERKKLEEQIQQTQKLESLGVLAGGIAHDFNNLLTAILGNLDLALARISPASLVRNNIESAQKASQRATDLCRQLLAYSGRGKFQSEPLDLNEMVEEMTHLLEVSVSKKIKLLVSLSKETPGFVGDPSQIHQIIMNLVINASEAIGDSTGTINLKTGVKKCDAEFLSRTLLKENLRPGEYIFLEVSDSGCGMDKETQERIFDPFFSTKFAGRGLGLAAVLGIVHGHKGAIRVYSEKGKGSLFSIYLPKVENPAGKGKANENKSDFIREKGMILLVDDEEMVRNLGGEMLEYFGFKTLRAADGPEAIEIFRQRLKVHEDEKIRCVILDLTMPKMDGEETYRELKRIDKKIPVIISSGFNEQEVSERFLGKGVSDFIQKPYQMETLLQKIRKVIS